MKVYFKIQLMILLILITGCTTKTYTVTFVDNNQELASIEIKKGDNIKDIDKPTKEGYIFFTWLKDGEEYNAETPITEDVTLTASWIEEPRLPNTYKVTFDFGTFKKTQTVMAGEKATEPKETPIKEKHKFIGWYLGNELYDFNKKVTSDIEITAKFEKNRILINYDLSGANGTVQVEIEKNTIPSKPKNPTKFGYTFTGWTIDGKAYNFNTPLNKDTTIKANFTANVYVKVTFDTSGGNSIPSQILISGSKLSTLPTPVKEGYTFKYWQLYEEQFSINTPITKNITLLAVYEKNELEELPQEEAQEEITEEESNDDNT